MHGDSLSVVLQVSLRKLNAAHAAGEKFAGLDVETGEAKDLQEDGLTDLLLAKWWAIKLTGDVVCLLYTSPSPRDQRGSRMPSSA